MARASRCPVCLAGADVLARVNAMLESNVRMATIVSEVGAFDVYKLSRHKNKCLLKPLNASDGSESDIWSQRAHDTYAQACIDGDTKARVSAISAAARSLEKLRKAEAAKAADELPDNCADWSEKQSAGFRKYTDTVLKEAVEKAKNNPDSSLASYSWFCTLSPETVHLLKKITGDPLLLTRVRELETNCIPER
jgi:hypothetical protein